MMNLLPKRVRKENQFIDGIYIFRLFLFLIAIIFLVLIVGVILILFNEKGDTTVIPEHDVSKFISNVSGLVIGAIGALVALLVAIFTFLAFYAQYEANKEIQKQFRVQQFESQFYKMLDLHISNYTKWEIPFYDHKTVKHSRFNYYHDEPMLERYSDEVVPFLRNISGAKIFNGMILELESCIIEVFSIFRIETGYEVEKFPNIKEKLLNYSYRLFFFGISSEQAILPQKYNSFDSLVKENLMRVQYSFYMRNLSHEIPLPDASYFKFYPFEGHEQRLSNYYRNLFALVKLVTDSVNDPDYGTPEYKKGRSYLKILRAQLSNAEQHLLYMNYRIGFGEDWDYLGKKNHLFTKYRMIHNLPVDRIVVPESPREHFKDYIKNSGEVSIDDPLFEWGDTN